MRERATGGTHRWRADPPVADGRSTIAEASPYEPMGGVFAIAAVVDHFGDAVAGTQSPAKHRGTPSFVCGIPTKLDRLTGLKFMRTLWLCNVAGGPFSFTATKPGRTPLGLEETHRDLHVSPEEFDEVAAESGRTRSIPSGSPRVRKMKSLRPSRRTGGSHRGIDGFGLSEPMRSSGLQAAGHGARPGSISQGGDHGFEPRWDYQQDSRSGRTPRSPGATPHRSSA